MARYDIGLTEASDGTVVSYGFLHVHSSTLVHVGRLSYCEEETLYKVKYVSLMKSYRSQEGQADIRLI